MASNEITLRIGMDEDAPCYKEDGVHDQRVRKFVEKKERSKPPVYQGRYPERNLDIMETATSGTQIYVFELEMLGLGHEPILFPETGPRLIKFPMGCSGSDNFLVELPDYAQNNRNKAAFSCNLDDLHCSDLAIQIRGKGEIHDHAIRIPFYFNFVDQVLGAAPWVIPNHAVRSSSDARGKPETHGGVHPNPLAFYSVSIEE